MESEKLVTKFTQIIQRQDGSEVRIVAQAFFGAGLTRSTGVCVHRRESPEHPWQLCGDQPHPDWRKMSVDDYIQFGRPEMLRIVSRGEIMKAVGEIGKPFAGEQDEIIGAFVADPAGTTTEDAEVTAQSHSRPRT